jgi:BMFP domain-containing protein YqiC
MFDPKLLDEIAAKFAALVAASPARDIEKNLRALATGTLARFDLVTREEFDLQRDALAKARDQLAVLEAQVAALEQRLGKPQP